MDRRYPRAVSCAATRLQSNHEVRDGRRPKRSAMIWSGHAEGHLLLGTRPCIARFRAGHPASDRGLVCARSVQPRDDSRRHVIDRAHETYLPSGNHPVED